MKIQRILGVFWLAFCGYNSILFAWKASQAAFIPNSTAHNTPLLSLFLGLFFCLVFLSSAVASIFLIRGAAWARRFFRLFALLVLIMTVIPALATLQFHLLDAVFCLFAVISAVLLFSPRHEPVA
jgi:hypothetical protein